MGCSHRLHFSKGPGKIVLPSTTDVIQSATEAAETLPWLSLSCVHSQRSGMFSFIYQIRNQKTKGTVRIAESIICSPCSASKSLTPPEWGKGLRKSLWTPHTQTTLSSNCCLLVGAKGTDQQNSQAQEQFFPTGYIHKTFITINCPFQLTFINYTLVNNISVHSCKQFIFLLLYRPPGVSEAGSHALIAVARIWFLGRASPQALKS